MSCCKDVSSLGYMLLILIELLIFYQHVLGFWLSNKVCKENKETASLISYLYLINRNDSQLFYLELVSFNELQRS